MCTLFEDEIDTSCNLPPTELTVIAQITLFQSFQNAICLRQLHYVCIYLSAEQSWHSKGCPFHPLFQRFRSFVINVLIPTTPLHFDFPVLFLLMLFHFITVCKKINKVSFSLTHKFFSRTVEEIVAYLSVQNNKNFVRSHGKDTTRYCINQFLCLSFAWAFPVLREAFVFEMFSKWGGYSTTMHVVYTRDK